MDVLAACLGQLPPNGRRVESTNFPGLLRSCARVEKFVRAGGIWLAGPMTGTPLIGSGIQLLRQLFMGFSIRFKPARSDLKFTNISLLPCTALLCVVFFFAVSGFTPPKARGLDAPNDMFSAARAGKILQHILAEQLPHPSGSQANTRVRRRIAQQLHSIGLDPRRQPAVGCRHNAKRARCVRTENVLATLPGSTDTALLFMAHFDSVGSAPGAGDNGAGVASLLQIARILKQGGPYKNTLIFLFTDAEEVGHFGAASFFSEHPLAHRVRAVINIDGAGSNGPAYVLRVAPHSEHLLRAYQHTASRPTAQSIRQAIITRTGVGTDFNEVLKAGLPGIDFSFTGRRNNNHSAADTLENFDLSALQHHGDNILPLAQLLADRDLTTTGGNVIYSTLHQSWWLLWRYEQGIAIALAPVMLLLFTTFRVRHWIIPREFTIATLGSIATVTATVVAGVVTARLMDAFTGGTVKWPANPLPLSLIIFSTPLAILWFSGLVFASRAGIWANMLACWWAWSVLALVLAYAIPQAAYLPLIPTVAATSLMFVLAYSAKEASPWALHVICTMAALIAGYFLFQLGYTNYIASGRNATPIIMLALGLLASVMMPLVINKDRKHCPINLIFAFTGGLLAVVGILLALMLSPYSKDSPQYINIAHIQNSDSNNAYYALNSPTRLPRKLLQDVGAGAVAIPAYPWRESMDFVAPAPRQKLNAPKLEILADSLLNGHRHISFRLSSSRRAQRLVIGLPGQSDIEKLLLEGEKVSLPQREGAQLRRVEFINPPKGGISGEIVLLPNSVDFDIYIADVTYTLPACADKLITARAALAVAYGDGDKSLVYRRVTLPPVPTTAQGL